MALAPVWLVSFFLHALIGWRVTPGLFAVYAPLALAFGVLLVLSAALVPMGLVARRVTKPPVSEVLTWMGLLCMGLFSTLLVLTVLREGVLLVVLALNALWPDTLAMAALTTHTALALPVVGVLITALGFWNARRTASVVHIDVPITNLPAVLQGFTVAQISDVHVGPTIKSGYLQRIVDQVNSLNADMVAITGDLVDGSVRELGAHVAPLATLSSTHGTFFVTGNHEYYSGAHSWIDALRALGIQVLMNEHVVLHHNSDSQDPERAVLVVAGVTDFTAHLFDESHRSNPAEALLDAPPLTLFKLLLAHQPRSAPAAAAAGFDLQLSGHTHGGQFWPWMYFVKLQQPFTAGLHKLESLWVYTSRGTGYWGPPKRFGAPSEITCLRLVRT
jgi:predicted MPP superfamily phosphohydrolase